MKIVNDAEQYQKSLKEVDPKTGKEINPYIPSFISKAPWYAKDGDQLSHQKKQQEEKAPIGVSVNRTLVQTTTKFRKGACQNCGALSHKTKDCLERPRKIGAKWTGKDIKPDEITSSIDLGFEAKRDRWNNYEGDDYSVRVADWEIIERSREKQRQEKARSKLDQKSSDSDDSEDDKYTQVDIGKEGDAANRVPVRNLRIREDTARYLTDLNASYDPKNRKVTGVESTLYGSDDFVKANTGTDQDKLAQISAFAWEAEKRGKDVHITANPTQGELLFKQYQEKKKNMVNQHKTAVLEKYGGQEHMDAPPKELLMVQNEEYVEYTETGAIKEKKGESDSKISKYPEDVYPGNHTSVWGSWWKDGIWGYACCHAQLKGAYCAGQAGIEALAAAPVSSLKRSALETDTFKVSKKPLSAFSSVTQDELEAYRLNRQKFHDPMANYKDEEE